ncbi:MAG: hypothetical protein VYA30_14315 [Myxococcota bacterium]|nr:hypothetical protein [Myxococcota bacterium]
MEKDYPLDAGNPKSMANSTQRRSKNLGLLGYELRAENELKAVTAASALNATPARSPGRHVAENSCRGNAGDNSGGPESSTNGTIM